MRDDALRLAVGMAAMAASWLIPRRIAAARLEAPAAVALDLMPALLAAALLLLASARPLFSGGVVLALGAGFAFADGTKRKTLREPVILSDMAEIEHLFTHPHLYLPFAGSTVMIAGAVAGIGAAAALLLVTPPLWAPAPGPALGCLLVLTAAGWALGREPLLSTAAGRLKRLRPTGDPLADAARLGPFAVLLVYGIIARAERSSRRKRMSALPAPALVRREAATPVVLVQCESFFDARRISPIVPHDMLAGLDACRQNATHGLLDIPAWGANSTRAEFAVLTGIDSDELGYDRFNPYHAFARAPVVSLASQLRAVGNRTICLHPFVRRFYRRDRTIPALGFETFLGREALGGSRRPPYRSDPELARQIVRILDAAGPRSFIFVVTIANHGPWCAQEGSSEPRRPRLAEPLDFPGSASLQRYLAGLAGSDEMLGYLLEELGPTRRDAVFGFYGDHLPSLPEAFDHFGFGDRASDYVLVDGAMSGSRRLDLAAHFLPWMILERLKSRGAMVPTSPALGGIT